MLVHVIKGPPQELILRWWDHLIRPVPHIFRCLRCAQWGNAGTFDHQVFRVQIFLRRLPKILFTIDYVGGPASGLRTRRPFSQPLLHSTDDKNFRSLLPRCIRHNGPLLRLPFQLKGLLFQLRIVLLNFLDQRLQAVRYHVFVLLRGEVLVHWEAQRPIWSSYKGILFCAVVIAVLRRGYYLQISPSPLSLCICFHSAANLATWRTHMLGIGPVTKTGTKLITRVCLLPR